MKITQEIIEQINELYLKIGIKSRVAKEIGVSPATVTKYLIPNYIAKQDRIYSHCVVEPNFNMEIFMGEFGKMGYLCELTDEEWIDLRELQKEVTV